MAQHRVSGDTLGEAYATELDAYLDDDSLFCAVVAHHPVDVTRDIDSTKLEDWRDVLNIGNEFERCAGYEFGKVSPITDGRTMEHWIDDRIWELHDGFYADKVDDWLAAIEDRLMCGMHGSSTNGLVAQVYDEDDLERATVPRPNAHGVACLTQMQFIPVRDRLHMHQTFRSQYVDMKGFGNMVAGATLLSQMAARTGYEAGSIMTHVNNMTTYDRNAATHLHARIHD